MIAKMNDPCFSLTVIKQPKYEYDAVRKAKERRRRLIFFMIHNPKAVLFSAILPGFGQVYLGRVALGFFS